MIALYILLVVLGIALGVIGLGMILRLLSYWARGIGMSWGSVFFLSLIGALALVVGAAIVYVVYPLALAAL